MYAVPCHKWVVLGAPPPFGHPSAGGGKLKKYSNLLYSQTKDLVYNDAHLDVCRRCLLPALLLT